MTLLLGGCTWKVIPPEVDGPVTPVIVSAYSKHTRIALPSGESSFIEFGFGDWNFYALGDTSKGTALQAAFDSEAAALSRRVLPWQGNLDRFRSSAGAVRSEVILVDAQRARTLLESLEAQWNALEGEEVYREWEDLTLRKWDEPYSLMRNSNHRTAAWLQELGCKVRGNPITQDFRVEPRPSPAAQD
ncbi:MAG: hypothetical protein R6V45_11340 [Oceanipulchritudo sp.]